MKMLNNFQAVSHSLSFPDINEPQPILRNIWNTADDSIDQGVRLLILEVIYSQYFTGDYK